MLAFCIMDFVTACKYAILGYRIKRAHWDGGYTEASGLYNNLSYAEDLCLEDYLANDWEIITEGIIKDFPIIYSD